MEYTELFDNLEKREKRIHIRASSKKGRCTKCKILQKKKNDMK